MDIWQQLEKAVAAQDAVAVISLADQLHQEPEASLVAPRWGYSMDKRPNSQALRRAPKPKLQGSPA